MTVIQRHESLKTTGDALQLYGYKERALACLVYLESCYSSLHRSLNHLLPQVVPAGSIRDSQLARLVAHLSNSPDVSQHQRSALKLKGMLPAVRLKVRNDHTAE